MTDPPLKNPGFLDAQRPHTLFFFLFAVRGTAARRRELVGRSNTPLKKIFRRKRYTLAATRRDTSVQYRPVTPPQSVTSGRDEPHSILMNRRAHHKGRSQDKLLGLPVGRHIINNANRI
eukprot:scaffold4859_cov128-Isochrysis_galbana.AAC.8